MGPKVSSSNSGEYTELLKDYEVLRQIDTEGLFFLRNKANGGDYLLREFTFNDRREFQRYSQLLQKRRGQLAGCKYVVSMEKVITKSEDQYCSTFYKIYALFEFTERTLEDEINERNLQRRKFQEKELWSILASCIVGLGHLQKNGIKHQALRSSSILISQEGVIKIFDPIVTGCQSNYDYLITNRSTPHIYLSPQLADSLQMEVGQPHSHAYKSDIWTMGMIVLQAGLGQYQDECYRDQCSRVHWETVQYNLHRFRQSYSQELAALVEFMLSREEKNRPDWLELQERVIKQEESRMSQVNISRASNVSRQSDKFYASTAFNLPVDKRLTVRETPGVLVTSNAVRVYQDPMMRTSTKGAELVGTKGITGQIGTSHARRPTLGESGTTPMVGSQPLRGTHLLGDTGSHILGSTQPLVNPQPLLNTQSLMSSQSPVQFKPSSIQSSRPLRNIFPLNSYITLTKPDQNLIIVPDSDRESEIESQSNSKNTSYFDSNWHKENAGGKAYHSDYSNTLGWGQKVVPHEMGKIPTQVNTYGVGGVMQREIYQTATSAHQGVTPSQQVMAQPVQQIQSPHTNQTAFSPPASTLPQPAPQGAEYVVQKYKQGSEYKGYKWQGMRHGFGAFYYQDGGRYEGEWRYNKMHGKGKLYYQSGKLAYEGDWANDEFQGFGKLYNQYPKVVTHPLNYGNLDEVEQMWTKYQGEFSGDFKNGRGVLFLTNGEFYDGEFRQDYAQGQGVYNRKSGEKVRGRWGRNIFLQ